MNNVSIFSPSFTDTLIDVFNKNLDNSFGFFTPVKKTEQKLPSVDVRETEKNYVMEIDLPGYSEKDVEIKVKDRTLTVSSVHNEEKTEEKKTEQGAFLIKERSASRFSRRFTLPQDVNSDEVSAQFENGVLTIDIPKKPTTQPRQIEIKKIVN